MAHALSLTDGSTTVSLSTGDNLLFDWTPSNAVLSNAAESITNLDESENVTEQVGIRIHDAADKPTVQADIRLIERMIAVAQTRELTGYGDRVYLKATIDGSSEVWQSEVVGGALSLAPGTLREWATVGANIELQLERRYFWERDGDQLLTIHDYSNNSTNIATLTNNVNTNFLTIQAGNLDGSLPTPIKIRMQNSATGQNGSNKFYISLDARNDAGTFDGWVNAAGLDVGSAFQTWSSSAHNITSPRWAWDLGSGITDAVYGEYYRLLVGFSGLSTQTYLKAALYDTSSGVNSVIHEGEEVYTGDAFALRLMDLGAFPLPPGGIDNPSNLRLGITARSSGSGNATVVMAQFMPTNGYRLLNKTHNSWNTNGYIVDNGIEGTAYSGDESARSAILSQYQQVYAWPGRLNKVRILYSYETTFPTSNNFAVTCWARPRRLTL